MEETKLLLDRGGKIHEGGKVRERCCCLVQQPELCTLRKFMSKPSTQ